MTWLADSPYNFANNPAGPCLALAGQEQQARRRCLRLLQAALPAQGDLFARPRTRREQVLADAAAALQCEIAAVDAEIEMATGSEVVA